MPDYFYDMDLVVDPLNPSNVVAMGSVAIYDPADTAGTTLLALKDPSGLPLPNPLTSNANGFLPPRIASVPQTLWKSGGFEGYFNSFKGLRDEAVSAVGEAQAAKNAAAQSAIEAAAAAVAPTDEQVDAGIVRADIPAVVAGVVASDSIPAVAAANAVATAMASQNLAWTLVQSAPPAYPAPAVTVNNGTVTYTTGKDGQAKAPGSVVRYEHSAQAVAAMKSALAFTIEAWVKTPTSGTYPSFFAMSNLASAGASVLVDPSNHARFSPSDLPGTKVITDGQWHHIAYCTNIDANGQNWTNGKVYVDGVLDITIGVTVGASDGSWLNASYIGGVRNGANGTTGTIDEFRLSKGIRYTGAFTPASKMTIDADTIAVAHFEGTTAVDLGVYPARPVGAPGGSVTYVGTTQPSTWLTRDRWINA